MSGRLQHEFTGRPRLLIAYADAAYASECGRYFRRLGWEVQMVASSQEAAELMSEYRPQVVVLDAELLAESRWLTNANPEVRVIVAADDTPTDIHDRIRCQSVRRRDGAEALAMSILGSSSFSEAI